LITEKLCKNHKSDTCKKKKFYTTSKGEYCGNTCRVACWRRNKKSNEALDKAVEVSQMNGEYD